MSARFEFDSRLDTRCLHALYGGDMGHALALFEMYVKGYPAVVEKCREVLLSGDRSSKIHYVHSRLNNFHFVGLTHLTKMREDLEVLCRQGKKTETHQQFSLIYEGFHQTFPLIQEEYQRLKEFVQQYSKR